MLVLIHAFAQLLGEILTFQSWQTVLQYGAGPLARGDRPALHQVIRFTARLDVLSEAHWGVGGGGIALGFGHILGWRIADSPLAPDSRQYIIVMAVSPMRPR